MADILKTPPPGGGMSANTSELIARLKTLEGIIETMNVEINFLKIENQKLKNENVPINPNINENTIQMYETDDEELAKETNWILQKRNSKKRKAVSSPELPSPSPKLVSTSDKAQVETKHKLRTPPIMISDISDYKSFYELIQKVVKSNFIIKLLNNEVYKINVFDSDEYRAVTKLLNAEKMNWYSFENKQTRPIKVVIKNLHHSWSSRDIVENLKAQNFNAISAINKLKFQTKEPLDMFLVSFDATENLKKMYEIKTILNTVVKIEPPKQSKWIPQCKTCQGFNHTKNYCARPPRCVKCAGKHKTEDCAKTQSEKPKCVNCGDEHPANYRGCLVAKELQKLRNKASVKEFPKTAQQSNTVPKIAKTFTEVNSVPKNAFSKTYAQVTKETKSKQHSADNNDALSKILAKLEKQELFNKQLEKRLSKLESSIQEKKHE